MIFRILITFILFLELSFNAFSDEHFYNLKANLYHGGEVDFATYKNKVLLITNFSIKCGTSYQLSDFEEVYQKYKNQAFEVLAFPTESFAPMEQKNGNEINRFCSKKYGVTFPVFETVHVKGGGVHDVFKHLTENCAEHHSGEVSYNAEKFLIGKDGKVIARYGPFTGVKSRRVTKDIEKALQ